jgi:hypothetical protein
MLQKTIAVRHIFAFCCGTTSLVSVRKSHLLLCSRGEIVYYVIEDDVINHVASDTQFSPDAHCFLVGSLKLQDG